jgi:hypothetical protein
MQTNPQLEKLDWVFTSADWTTEFSNTLSFPLAKLGSDHTPIHVSIGNNIPKSCIFIFENYWMEFDGFMEITSNRWTNAPLIMDSAKNIMSKFKATRYGLKKWSKQLSNLSTIIKNCHYTLALLDGLKDQRNLSLVESNFRKILESHT